MTTEQAKMNEAKNMALLFFMDHLMQKNGRRTIHDLSCQFGARGFSQEMRDAVGATQEGLTDFLRQHPSLFTIENDQVVLKGFGELDGKNQLMKMPPGGRQRDYTSEAVDFFVAKLEKFGPELQIKSLLGHRSQAAPEVRLVSGRHLREFYEFLESQTEYFIVEGDRVRLANIPEPKITDESEILDDEGRPLAGMKAKQATVDFLKGVLDQSEDTPIPLDAFYKRFCERFPHSVRQDVATNPKELLQFLKLNRNIFFIRSNKVSLVRAREDDGTGGVDDGGRSTASPDSANCDSSSPPISAHANNLSMETWEMFTLNRDNLHRVHLVKALKMAQDIVGNITNDINNNNSITYNNNNENENGDKEKEKFICLDFKLVTLGGSFHHIPGSAGEEFLSMICIATPQRVAVFDLAHSDSILMESGLKELLENPGILKVIHDVKRVATLLAQRYAVNMRNVFDTQIAHTIIQHEKFSKPLSELHSISFVNLQRVYFPQSLMLSDVTPRKLSQTPNWSQRPISDELLLTASEECHCLMRELYRNVLAKLPKIHQQLFETKCLEALTPLPTRPPPQLPVGIIGTATKFGGVSSPSSSLIVPPPLFVSPSLGTKGGVNVDIAYNGIYRPPARRRFLGTEMGALPGVPQPGTLIPNETQFSPAIMHRKASTLVNGNNNNNNGFMPYVRSNSSNETNGSLICQQCYCQQKPQLVTQTSLPHASAKPVQKTRLKPKMVDSSTQTVSTGKITMHNIYYEEDDENKDSLSELVSTN